MDDSLLIISLTGRMEFKSLRRFRTWNDCEGTERRGLELSHIWPTEAERKEEHSSYQPSSVPQQTGLEWLQTWPSRGLLGQHYFSQMALKHKRLLNEDPFPSTMCELWHYDSCSLLERVKGIPSTQMYLFLHCWELVLGKALASRTEITYLSHLQNIKKYIKKKKSNITW